MQQRAKIWSITATDSSGGAGAFADVKVAQRLGCHLEVVVIAVSAQNSQGIQAVQLLDVNIIQAQWQALRQDGWPAVIRLGWLPAQPALFNWLLQALHDFNGTVIWDPVLGASNGNALTQIWQNADVLPSFIRLLQRADVITPNVKEAQALAHLIHGAENTESTHVNVKTCAQALTELGAKHVLITGLETAEGQLADYFHYSKRNKLGFSELPGPSLLAEFYLTKAKIKKGTDYETHGTGCHLAASLACLLAKQVNLYDALVQAVCGTALAIESAATNKDGASNAWASHYKHAQRQHWPQVRTSCNSIRLPFPKLSRALGVYGLVDSLQHLQRLITLGIDTLQWRVKNPDAEYIKHTKQAIQLCQSAGIPLFINDDWRLAIELNAYGVHLGQEDLATADLSAIQTAGLRLGISTHSDWEVARAYALQPSYIALGPVFKPLSKELKYEPLGLKRLAAFVQRYPETSFTCIGGITQHNAAQIWQNGVQSIAVVTDLAHNEGLEQRLAKLRQQTRLLA